MVYLKTHFIAFALCSVQCEEGHIQLINRDICKRKQYCPILIYLFIFYLIALSVVQTV
jgi:hypothetical protein